MPRRVALLPSGENLSQQPKCRVVVFGSPFTRRPTLNLFLASFILPPPCSRSASASLPDLAFVSTPSCTCASPYDAIPQWLVIVVIALLLSGANIYGYTKCNADAKNKVSKQPQTPTPPRPSSVATTRWTFCDTVNLG